MKLDDLKTEWKNEVIQMTDAERVSNVIDSLEKETTKLDKTIKRRDYLEISIALLIIPVWTWKLFYAASLMQTVGLWIAIFACLLIPYKLLKAKQVDTQKDDSVLAFLNTEKNKLEQQMTLLESVAVWYIAPLFTAIILITAGATVDASGIPQITEQLTIYYGCCVLLVVGIYFLNKRAVKKQLSPLLDNVNKRIQELSSFSEVAE
jgi:C4-dicarboxylate transporter